MDIEINLAAWELERLTEKAVASKISAQDLALYLLYLGVVHTCENQTY